MFYLQTGTPWVLGAAGLVVVRRKHPAMRVAVIISSCWRPGRFVHAPLAARAIVAVTSREESPEGSEYPRVFGVLLVLSCGEQRVDARRWCVAYIVHVGGHLGLEFEQRGARAMRPTEHGELSW